MTDLTEKCKKIERKIKYLQENPEEFKKFAQEWNAITVRTTLWAQRHYENQMCSLRKMPITYVTG